MSNGGSDTDRSGSLTEINWQQAFPFTSLFRTFRLAIHPSKLILALAAVLICYLGGRVLDGIAGKRVVVSGPGYMSQLPAEEIRQYTQTPTPTATEFYRWRDEAIRKRDQELANMLVAHLGDKPSRAIEAVNRKEAMDRLNEALESKRNHALSILRDRYAATQNIITADYERSRKSATEDRKQALDETYKHDLKYLRQARDFLQISMSKSSHVARMVLKIDADSAVGKLVRTDSQAEDKTKDARQVQKDRDAVLAAIRLADSYDRAQAMQGKGVFAAALSYGILMFNCAVNSVLSAEMFFNEQFNGFTGDNSAPPGLMGTLGLAAKGLSWFARIHWLYFTIYTLFCLAVWAIAGGAICRIAALHACRDEKIPLKEAFRFGLAKFTNFFTAPLMPVICLLGCCVFLWVGGLVGAIPWLGELIVGPLFFLALIISFVLALVIVGAIGGLGLMYPTIAVEGSDALDAFSRSYSYVYSRPWRTIFYTVVAAIYGTLCFVFVKLFVGLIFLASWTIVGMTMDLRTAALAGPLGKLSAMWYSPAPLTGPFFGQFFLFPLKGTEPVGAFFIAVSVFVLVGLVIAFAVSFFFSAYTLIYLLLRQRVDATGPSEVFVEQFEAEAPVPQPAPEQPGPAVSEPVEEPADEATPPTPGETEHPEPPDQTSTAGDDEPKPPEKGQDPPAKKK